MHLISVLFIVGFFCRKLFDNFDPSSIAQYTEKKMLSLKVDGSLLLSEPKLRAVVENAKQMLKVIIWLSDQGKRGENSNPLGHSNKAFILPCLGA